MILAQSNSRTIYPSILASNHFYPSVNHYTHLHLEWGGKCYSILLLFRLAPSGLAMESVRSSVAWRGENFPSVLSLQNGQRLA
ncbi:hypothetical protein HZ326_17042 [Fusarium oxysporum f. sp. albedinis]|nr:hypothetical protein HZ326_17042 [Fusarium oxysporum f. sp. albedinis]